MTGQLSDFLYQAATDPEFLRAFNRDPGEVVARFGFTAPEREAVLCGDDRRIRRLLGPKPEPDDGALVVSAVLDE